MFAIRVPRPRRTRRIRAVTTIIGASILAIVMTGGPALASGALPSGERMVGQSSVEPAYNDQTGTIIYLSTPIKSPFPTHTNWHSVAPLYLVEYPPSATNIGTLNCMGIPGNCPDHDLAVAAAATFFMPSVYGTDPTLVPGHDHLVAPPGHSGDFNIAWEVVEVLFTNADAANTHITTEAQIEAAVGSGNAIEVDLGFAFHCSVVAGATYAHAAP